MRWHQLNFPTCAFLKTLDAVSTMESIMPATVNVPPTIAHTWETTHIHSYFHQCFEAVGWVIWPVKIVPEMTYKVSRRTLWLACRLASTSEHWWINEYEQWLNLHLISMRALSHVIVSFFASNRTCSILTEHISYSIVHSSCILLLWRDVGSIFLASKVMTVGSISYLVVILCKKLAQEISCCKSVW